MKHAILYRCCGYATPAASQYQLPRAPPVRDTSRAATYTGKEDCIYIGVGPVVLVCDSVTHIATIQGSSRRGEQCPIRRRMLGVPTMKSTNRGRLITDLELAAGARQRPELQNVTYHPQYTPM